MTVLGHTIVWGTHIGDRRTTDAKGLYAQCKTWWANRRAMRQEAERAALNARWDAQREVVRTPHAESVAMVLYALGV